MRVTRLRCLAKRDTLRKERQSDHRVPEGEAGPILTLQPGTEEVVHATWVRLPAFWELIRKTIVTLTHLSTSTSPGPGSPASTMILMAVPFVV